MNKLLIAVLSLFISGCAVTNPNYAAQDESFDLWWKKEYQRNRQDCLDAELLVSNLNRNVDQRVYSLSNGEICSYESV